MKGANRYMKMVLTIFLKKFLFGGNDHFGPKIGAFS